MEKKAEFKRAKIIELDPNDHILVVCANGRTRSKYVARELKNMGFENPIVMGLNNPNLKDSLVGYSLIVAVGEKDILARLKYLLGSKNITPILHLRITEVEHAQMHLWHERNLVGQIHELLKPKMEQLPIRIKPQKPELIPEMQ